MVRRTLRPPELAAACESIGRNCEFGLVQRNLGLEPIHLLRWAGSQMPGLVAAFENGFADLADEMTGHSEEAPVGHAHSRWMLTCQRYGIAFHVEAPKEAEGPEQAGAASMRRLRWQASHLLTGIASCERILVYASRQISTPDQCAGLVEAIRRHGKTPILLVGQAAGASGDVTPTSWSGVWFASTPMLTRVDWAAGVDQSAWMRILENFADVIHRM